MPARAWHLAPCHIGMAPPHWKRLWQVRDALLSVARRVRAQFCFDLAQRLAPDESVIDGPFFEDVVLAESESLLVNMPSVQQALTRSVTRQARK